ncbi:hypothetical protein Y1Q_0010704 [Alligator mississippiensis]|uniref:Uncharacterized protein n=1 Tax=Alligator mississippiensis TaxID=8496 RepID=A0A151M6J5_ALLMI|nr:hypothetical protein Y1Q_0010704 [Alligator mississippiensis]
MAQEAVGDRTQPEGTQLFSVMPEVLGDNKIGPVLPEGIPGNPGSALQLFVSLSELLYSGMHSTNSDGKRHIHCLTPALKNPTRIY